MSHSGLGAGRAVAIFPLPLRKANQIPLQTAFTAGARKKTFDMEREKNFFYNHRFIFHRYL